MDALLDAIAGKRVLVVGDFMLDEYIWGEVRRISPEAPVPVVAIRRRNCVPGGAGNTAMNVASLGGRALLAGVVGADTAGERLRSAFAQHGLATHGVLVDKERATTTKTRIVAHHQHVVRIDEEQVTPLALALEEELLRWLERLMPEANACVLSDYGKGVVSTRLAQHFLDLARQAGKPVVVDPKGTNFAKYRGATVVKPNMEEAKLAFPHAQAANVARSPLPGNSASGDGGPAGLVELAHALLDLLNDSGRRDSALLLTRGADGMSLFECGAPPLHIPSVARDVFDVTGAGDTVTGTLALALAAGASLTQAAQLANRAAGIVVGKVGTAQVTREELR
jgi:D-beta-D-heptose 7-phosphate kinase/D-beta-D-heptose 1-phosphate adenosyltransferase